MQPKDKVAEEDEVVGELVDAAHRYGQALVGRRAKRVHRRDHAIPLGDWVGFDQRSQSADVLGWELRPDELRMAVGETGAGEPALVDQREHRAALAVDAAVPGVRDEYDLGVVEFRERTHVLGRMDDNLLPLEGRVQVRDDANAPRVVSESQHFRRCPVLAPAAEGAALELLVRRWLDFGKPRAGAVAAAGRKDDPATRQRVFADVGQLGGLVLRPASRNGLNSSIGSGRMIVDERSELISSIVCRKRSWRDMGFSARTRAAFLSCSDAWNSPSAAITFARRSRSASACRAMARCMPPGISTSLTSTIETLTPHGEVASSMIRWRISLILSRSERSSSSVCWPRTLRKVVWEI